MPIVGEFNSSFDPDFFTVEFVPADAGISSFCFGEVCFGETLDPQPSVPFLLDSVQTDDATSYHDDPDADWTEITAM